MKLHCLEKKSGKEVRSAIERPEKLEVDSKIDKT